MVSYDEFAAQWRTLKRQGTNYSHIYLEKPAMQAKVPDLTGKRVLALGCGSGEECRHLLDRGASAIVGIDASEGLLRLAREDFRAETSVEFTHMSLEDLDFPPASFDYVYSSLAMHYTRDWSAVLRKLRSATTPNSRVLFSTHHPVIWGGQVARTEFDDTRMVGYRRPTDPTQVAEVFGDYRTARIIEDRWFGQLDVRFFHKPFAEMFREIRAAGYAVVDLVEPAPTEAARELDRNFYEITSRIPPFVIFELE